MAQRPQGCKTTVVTVDTQLWATTVLNKNVYGLTVSANGATAGVIVALRDSVAGTIRWRGRVSTQLTTGTQHFDFGRYGINFPAGCYIQFTGEANLELTVIWD